MRGWIGVILRDEGRHALFGFEDDATTAALADAMVGAGRGVFARGDGGSRVIEPGAGADHADELVIGGCCAAAAMGMAMGHRALPGAAGLALARLTGRTCLIVAARRAGEGTSGAGGGGYVTELETMVGVVDEAGARSNLERHPAVLAREAMRAWREAMEGMAAAASRGDGEP